MPSTLIHCAGAPVSHRLAGKRIAVVALAVLGVVAPSVHLPIAGAATNEWIGGTSTSWGTGSNWSQGSKPGAADLVELTNLSSVVAETTAAALADQLRFSGITSSGFKFNNATNTITLSADASVLNIGLLDDGGSSQLITINPNLVLGGTQNETWEVDAIPTNSNSSSPLVITSGVAIANVVSGTAGITKTGIGYLQFNSANFYTGNTTIDGGTLVLNKLNNIIPSTSTLSLAGGNLLLTGKATGTTAQTFNNLVINAGGGQVLVDPNGGTSSTITLGTITDSSVGASALFGEPLIHGTGNAIIKTSTTTLTNGIFDGRLVYYDGTNDNWLTESGGTLAGLATYTAMNLSGADSNNSTISASAALSGNLSTNTLKINSPAASQTLALGANSLTVNTGGLLFTGSNAFTITGNAGVVGLNGGNLSNGGLDLIIQQYASASLTISAVVSNNGGNASNITALTKAGPGTLILSGLNTYTGPTTLSGGIVNVGSADSPGTSGPLGASGTISFSGGTLQYSTANKVDYSSRFSTAANQAISIDTNGQSVTFASALTSAGGSLTKLGAGTLTLGGTTAGNTYTGPTYVLAGTLTLNKTSATDAIPAGPLIIGNGTTAATVLLNKANQIDDATRVTVNANGVLDLNGKSETFSELIGAGTVQSLVAGSTLTIGESTSGLPTVTTFSGSIIDGGTGALNFTKTSGSTILLTGSGNTFAGALAVNNGTLQVSTFGDTNTGAGTINMATAGNTAILQYVGSANVVTTRAINIVGVSGPTAVVDSSGTGTLTISSVSSSAGTGPRTFTLQGSNAGINTVNGLITDGTGVLSLDKEGTTTWLLPLANTYSGITTIGGGVLQSGIANALPITTAITFGSAATNGTLDLNGSSQQLAGLAVAAAVPTASIGSQIITNTGSADAVLTFAGNVNSPSTFGGTIQDGPAHKISLAVNGGILTLTGANSYSGTTSVLAGTLGVNGTLTALTNANGVTVASGAMLTGAGGTINRPVEIQTGGAIAVTSGILTMAGGAAGTGLTLDPGAQVVWAPGATPASVQLDVDTLSASGPVDVLLQASAFATDITQPYVFIQWSGAGPTSTAGWSIDPASTASGNLTYQSTGANSGEFVLTNVVPEPASAAVLAVAGSSLLLRRRRPRFLHC